LVSITWKISSRTLHKTASKVDRKSSLAKLPRE
jgi:hypothetical protein